MKAEQFHVMICNKTWTYIIHDKGGSLRIVQQSHSPNTEDCLECYVASFWVMNWPLSSLYHGVYAYLFILPTIVYRGLYLFNIILIRRHPWGDNTQSKQHAAGSIGLPVAESQRVRETGFVSGAHDRPERAKIESEKDKRKIAGVVSPSPLNPKEPWQPPRASVTRAKWAEPRQISLRRCAMRPINR
ncbi:hypothetical protein RRG08_012990 [Elysia crispata]|uniref:Uncharacterized protein n=1 Tax=Elysia crispata TaxID=231223 RepID=A0AAE0ZZT1_9GAST|nr:hypothetical protein RRG08_012990 [Elysia crispata]